MKYRIFITVSIIVPVIAFSQSVYHIKADSILLTNDSMKAELILENQTRNISGFLYNKGSGRTEFRKAFIKLNDTTYIFGGDTILLASPKRFGAEDNRSFGNRKFSGANTYSLVIDSSFFAVTGKDSAGVYLPAELQGAGTRMFFYPRKSAFRAGTVTGNNWDTANIGHYSTAFGYNSKASGDISFAAGSGIATGRGSTAFGTSIASGNFTFASGDSAVAAGDHSVSIGRKTIAQSPYSIALSNGSVASDTGAISIGYNTTASGNHSLAAGNTSSASGDYAYAMGLNASATGDYSYALGAENISSGLSAITLGYNNRAKQNYQAVIGRFNDTTDTKNLFAVGYGSSNSSRKNVFTVDTSGKTHVGSTAAPASSLQVNGSVAAVVTTVTANTTLSANHYTVLADASAGNITITLPAASGCTGRIYTVKLVSSSNSVTIQRTSPNTIDGATSVVLNTQFAYRQFQSNGTHWYVTGKN